MPWINTAELAPNAVHPDQQQLYNGLDCCVTHEVWQELVKIQGNTRNPIYGFERALQAPAIDMMLRGFAVDESERRKGVDFTEQNLGRLKRTLDTMALAVWDKPLNARSTQQLQKFFYSHMKLPEQWISQKGVRKLSMNREVLEKLEMYFHAMPIVATIIAIRDNEKTLETLTKEVDPDGRMRTSYNIAGTESGRWSSSTSVTGTGGNQQNISPRLRRMFVADPGKKLCGIDLEQAESREVGWLHGTLFNDWRYLDACYAGDLHTTTARLVWPGLPWTGDLKKDRAIADQIFYREFSYRDMSKRGGHGTSYYGTPFTMARHLKVPVKVMQQFQLSFFDAYPAMPLWHRWTAQQLQTTQCLTTIFGRERHFFGRPNDDTTLREAIAFLPQSATADRMNLIMWRLWKRLGNRIQLLAQVHDAVYFQFDESDNELEIVETALSLFDIPITHSSGHRLVVPGEAKTGWNWASEDPGKKVYPDGNPEGLRKFKGKDDRRRRVGLDRLM